MPGIILLLAATLLLFGPPFLATAAQTNVHMLVPGFTVQELPVRLPNINNLRFAPDGRLTALGYDGRVWLLRDSDGDGLEDEVDLFWEKPTLRVPVGMAWSTAGLIVSSQGKVSVLRDTDGDGKGDTEEIIASGWPKTDVASGGVDATAATLDREGNIYFGLLTADYSNPYRLRKRAELKPDEKAWLEARGDQGGPPDEQVSLYDTNSLRGTIQKWNARTRKLETLATGIRVPYTLAFNQAGDLFVTDQEGETWCPNGNPLDELNHIIPGRHYGFPPRHERWLPTLVSESPVAAFGPQHQSTCGFVFNEPHPPSSNSQFPILNSQFGIPAFPAQGRFGPSWWEGDAIVTGESRGKLWRVPLRKTPRGYSGHAFLVARLDLLTTDVAISPKGDLYVSCHSGPPDWGTGPKGDGKLFRVSHTDPNAPQPVAVWATNATEVRVTFDKPIDAAVTNLLITQLIEFSEYARAADRYEVLKPPYKVVKQQEATPRGRLRILSATIDSDQRLLALTTERHSRTATYALAIPRLRAKGASTEGETVDVDYRFTASDADGDQPSAPADSSASKADFVVNDWGRGKNLFFGQQLKCGTCHRIRGEGGFAGPDLSNLVSRDTASVLRDIREPSAAINPDYIAHNVTLQNGDELSGVIRAQDNVSLKLATADGKETLLPRTALKAFQASSVSLMPSGLLDGLKESQLRDLLTFLFYEPPRRTKAEVNAALRTMGAEARGSKPETLSIVLVATKQDHGPGEHDYPAWQKKWNLLLASASGVTVADAWQWPSAEQFQSAHVLVFYYWNHDWSAARYAQLDQYLARGGGVVVLHSATIADKDPEQLAERLGLAAQPQRTKYLHCPFDLTMTAPTNHPIMLGLPRRIPFIDEPYWPMIGDAAKVEVLATTEQEGKSWPMIWTFQKGKGRVFASILGHYSWTHDDPLFRILVLRGMAWAAGADAWRLEKLATQGVDLQP